MSMRTGNTAGIYRLEAQSLHDTGFERSAPYPGDPKAGHPERFVYLFHEDVGRGLRVGISVTSDSQSVFDAPPSNEFIHVLAGRAVVTDSDGVEASIDSGQNLIVHDSGAIGWKPIGSLRMFFIGYSKPTASTPEAQLTPGGLTLLDSGALESEMKPEAESIGGGVQRNKTVFSNGAGNVCVGVWDSTAFESEMQAFSMYEFARILQGEVTITQADGAHHHFVAGEAMLISVGTVCSWKATGYLKKYYATLEPPLIS